ncbi:MAG: cell division protein FtsL [Acutalibacteraceae bacterium]|jgi:cell division protein FtsL
MAANQYGTEAYELSLFEPRKAKIVELKTKKPNKKQIKAAKRRARLQKILNVTVIAAVAAVVIGFVGISLTSRVQLNEMNAIITARNEELQTLKDEYERLKTELASKTSAQAVSEYAVNELGMQKIEPHQIQYITVEDGDSVEIANEDDQNVLQKIGAAISDFFAYLF